MTFLTRWTWLWCAVWWFGAGAMAGEPAVRAVVALPTMVPPSAELVAAAMKAGLATGPLVLTMEPGAARTGDGAITLITLWSKGTQKQWLMQFELDAMSAEEKVQAQEFNQSMTILGQHLKFSGKPTLGLKVRVIGPFVTQPYEAKTAAKGAKDQISRAFVNEEFLAMGMDETCRLLLGPDPEKPDNAKILGGSLVSLFSFFMLAEKIPALRSVMWEVVDLPSLWAILRNRNFSFSFSTNSDMMAEVDPKGWGLAAVPLYRYPFFISLAGKPAINSMTFVTAPRPPLRTTAGVVGFTAESPSHPQERHMMMQVLSIYRGPAPASDAPGKD